MKKCTAHSKHMTCDTVYCALPMGHKGDHKSGPGPVIYGWARRKVRRIPSRASRSKGEGQ